MKILNTKEWIAVIISVFVVGFFFIFGQILVSFFNSNASNTSMVKTPQVLTQDTSVGGGEQSLAGNRVTVNYVGRFVDGKVFDSS